MNRLLYRIAWWASWHRIGWLAGLIYRYRCPYPVGDWYSPRKCFAEGMCGCDNAARFASHNSCKSD